MSTMAERPTRKKADKKPAETTTETTGATEETPEPTPEPTPAEKPKRQTRARRATKKAEPKVEDQPAAAKPKRKAPAKRQARTRIARTQALYFEDENGVLSPLGIFEGDTAEDVLSSYLAALTPSDREQAYAASNYAVDTSEGIVRLSIVFTVEIARR